MITTIRRLWEHIEWADREVLRAVRSSGDATPEAVRELAHVLGTEETWLARIQGREPTAPVWPETPLEGLDALLDRTHARGRAFVESLGADDLGAEIHYANSAGERFTNTVEDILVHVSLHGQYHRGKVNLILRRAGSLPAPTDFIAFVRGAPAATEATSRQREGD